MLAGEMVVAGIEQHALRARRIIHDAAADFAPSAQRTTSARTELVP